MSHYRMHSITEIKGRAWLLPTEESLEVINDMIMKDADLIKRLNSGCYYMGAGIDINSKPIVFLVYCSAVNIKAIEEVARRVKARKGKELAREEKEDLIKFGYSKIQKLFSKDRWN